MSIARRGVALVFLGWGITVAGGAEFRGLGFLNPDEPWSEAGGISRNGEIVTGTSWVTQGRQRAVAWRDETIVNLGRLPGSAHGVVGATCASDDGRVLAGYSNSYASGSSGYQAFRWEDGVMTPLGFFGGSQLWSAARGMSADGEVIVGSASNSAGGGAAVWRDNTMIALPPALGHDRSEAWAVSADGSVVVGGSGLTPHAARWTDEQVEFLPTAENHRTSLALAVSADGQAAAGYTLTDLGTVATLWRDGTALLLGDLPGGGRASIARGISANGEVVVGESDDGMAAQPFVWTAATGMRSLRDVLFDDHGLDIGDWVLGICHGVSDDGCTLVGEGADPQGHREAWIAIIPEPASGVALAAVGLMAVRRRR